MIHRRTADNAQELFCISWRNFMSEDNSLQSTPAIENTIGTAKFRALNRFRFYIEITYSVVDCSVIYVTHYCPYFLAARITHS